MSQAITWHYHDGGRKAAGFKGTANDCVARATAIVTGIAHREVYDALNLLTAKERLFGARRRKSSARTGIYKPTTRRYLASLRYEWTPTMAIGQGCNVHLRAKELPPGRLMVQVSKHVTAVIDGVLYDTHDCSRGGTRCVYGYWTKSL